MNSPHVSKLIGKIMAGSWRALPPPLEVSDRELLSATPWLLQSGAGRVGLASRGHIQSCDIGRRGGAATSLSTSHFASTQTRTLYQKSSDSASPRGNRSNSG
jgi:hypothetical protein